MVLQLTSEHLVRISYDQEKICKQTDLQTDLQTDRIIKGHANKQIYKHIEPLKDMQKIDLQTDRIIKRHAD